MSSRPRSPPKAKIGRAAKRRLAQATEDLAVAERELHLTLSALPSALRAEKRMIGAALRLALDKLSAAKGKLEALLQD